MAIFIQINLIIGSAILPIYHSKFTKMKNYFFIQLFALMLISNIVIAQENYQLGAIIDEQEMKTATSALPVDFNLRGKSSSLPMSVNLSEFAATARQQEGPTCTGFAASNAFTIMNAMKNNIRDKTDINTMAFSAYYIFNRIQEDGCNNGSRISNAMQLLRSEGDCFASDFDYVKTKDNCSTQPTEDLKKKANSYRIKDFVTTFTETSSENLKIVKTREQLAKGRPVVIGMAIPQSFFLAKSGTKTLDINTADTNPVGSHAMCVVGYDVSRKAILIMNSWGTDWADNGFIWMRDADYAKYVKYGYSMILESIDTPLVDPAPIVKPTPVQKDISLKGSFTFRTPSGFDENTNSPIFKGVAPTFTGSSYLISDWNMRDVYQLKGSEMTKDSYIYVFSIDSKNKAELHFPNSFVISNVDSAENVPISKPLVPDEDAGMIIPSAFNALQSVHAGTDHICVIYSYKEIKNISARILKIKESKEKDFVKRLDSGFDDVLMSMEDIEYDKESMTFNASSSTGYVVPIVLNVIVK